MKLGIDLGGSHVGIGIIDENYNIINKIEENFTSDDKYELEKKIIEKININANKLLNSNGLTLKNIESVGIACPGTIKDGIVVKAGNLGLKNFHLKEELQKIWNIKINVENDGKCAALAEKRMGALKDFDDCIFLNIGTGIGGAVFMKGELLKPKACSGFEIGHMTIQKDGIQCNCGKKGCFERYCSMRVLKERIRKEFGFDDTVHSQELLAELKKENEISNNILNEYIENLKIGVANLIDIFEPEAICFGGSFAFYEDLLLPRLKEELFKENVTFNSRKDIQIKVALMKNDAGIIGSI